MVISEQTLVMGAIYWLLVPTFIAVFAGHTYLKLDEKIPRILKILVAILVGWLITSFGAAVIGMTSPNNPQFDSLILQAGKAFIPAAMLVLLGAIVMVLRLRSQGSEND